MRGVQGWLRTSSVRKNASAICTAVGCPKGEEFGFAKLRVKAASAAQTVERRP